MLNYEYRKKLEKATSVYHTLLKYGEINLDEESVISTELQDEEIKEMLDVLVTNAESFIFEVNKMVYLIPEIENKVIAFNNSEIKEEMLGSSSAYTMEYLYLCYYIFITFLSLMYEGEGYNPKTRDSIRIDDLRSEVDKRLKPHFNLSPEDEPQVIDFKIKFNITAVSKLWNTAEEHKDRKNIKNQKSQIGLIDKTFEFFRKQGLVQITNRKIEITPTRKLDEIIKQYYTHPDREHSLIKLLGGVEIE